MCRESPGQSWLVIGQLDTVWPSHWLSPADGDIRERCVWCHSETGKLSPMIQRSVDLVTTPSLYKCTVYSTGPITLYSAGHFSLGWSSAPVYCHTVKLVIKQTSPGRLLSTCQDPDCPVGLRAQLKGIFLTCSVKREKDWSQILLTSGSQVHFSHCQRQRRVLRKYTVCFFVNYADQGAATQ